VKAGDLPPLTAAQKREIERRVRDADDRTRYLIVSGFGPRFALYYNVSDDTYAMNSPELGTLFKRRAAATAVQGLLGSGTEILRCRVDRAGQLVKGSVPRLRRPTFLRRKAPRLKAR